MVLNLILDQGLRNEWQQKNQAIMIVIHDCIFDFPVFIGFEALWISAKYDNIPFIFVTTGFMDRRQVLLILSKFKRINYLLLPWIH